MRKGYIFIIATLIILAGLDIIYDFNFGQISEHQASIKEMKGELATDEPVTSTIEYGLEIDSLEINEEKIKKNETWIAILTRYNVPQDQVEKIQAENLLKEIGKIR